jgi:hypothetical protein
MLRDDGENCENTSKPRHRYNISQCEFGTSILWPPRGGDRRVQNSLAMMSWLLLL